LALAKLNATGERPPYYHCGTKVVPADYGNVRKSSNC